MAKYSGQGTPYEVVRLGFCERIGGWTFEQFDATPAQQIYEALEIWRIQDRERELKYASMSR